MQSYPNHTRFRIRAGFTLIELLTVIAIIGILAAILIPTVGKVRDTAKKAQCVSRLRQWGSLVNLCSNDSKNYVGIFFKNDAGLLYDPYISKNKMMSDESKIGSSSRNVLPTEAFTLCPNGLNNDSTVGGTVYQYSFVVPLDVGDKKKATPFGSSSDEYYYRQSDAIAPGKLLLMIEQANGKSLVSAKVSGIEGALKSPAVRRTQLDAGYIRHGGLANALFLDGHVASLTAVDTDYSNSDSRQKLDRYFNIK